MVSEFTSFRLAKYDGVTIPPTAGAEVVPFGDARIIEKEFRCYPALGTALMGLCTDGQWRLVGFAYDARGSATYWENVAKCQAEGGTDLIFIPYPTSGIPAGTFCIR